MAQFGVWYTKGYRVGTRSSSAIWVEASDKEDAIKKSRLQIRYQQIKDTHHLDRVVGPY